MNKKIVVLSLIFAMIFACVLFLMPPAIENLDAAENVGPQYARVIGSNVKLYRSPTEVEDYSNVYFVIPESYFVKLISYENDLFFSAKYLNIYGYVKISEVKCVKGVPETPYVEDANFIMWIPGGIDLRSSPSETAGLNFVAHIERGEVNLQFIGEIDGDEAVLYKGTRWYYCRYFKGGQDFYGYVYSEYCYMLTKYDKNTEPLEYIDEPIFETENTSGEAISNEETSLSSLPTFTQVLIIIAICIPCILIIYLLFRPTRLTAKAYEKANEKSKKRKKSRHQDYYEYDE